MSLLRTAIRRRLATVLPLACALSGALLVTPATAGDVSSPAVHKVSFRGQSVEGHGWIPVTDPCLDDTFVSVAAGSTRDGEWVEYSEFSYNHCTDQGSGLSGSAVPTTFAFSGNLASVHLVASIPLTSFETGLPAGSVALDNTWTATRPVTRERAFDIVNIPGGWVYRWSFKGTSREAVATGTVSLTSGLIARGSYLIVEIQHT